MKKEKYFLYFTISDDELDRDVKDDVNEGNGLAGMDGSKGKKFCVDVGANGQGGYSTSGNEKSQGSKTLFPKNKRKLNGTIKVIRDENPRAIGFEKEEQYLNRPSDE